MDDYRDDYRDDHADDYPDDYGTAPEAEPPPRPAFLNRFWMIFVRPGELFGALAQNPAWFPILLLVAAGTAAIMSPVPAELFEQQWAAGGADSPEAATMLSYAKPISIGIMLVALPVVTFAISGLTYAVLVFLRGDEATYKQHLCVVAHSGIISLVGGILTLFLQLNAGDLGVQLSVATLTPFLADGFLFNFLNSMPLFQLWAIVVTGIGLAAIDARRSAGPTIAVLMVIQLIAAAACAGVLTAVSPGS